MVTKLNDIIGALPHLTTDELKTVKAAIERLSTKSSSPGTVPPLYYALTAVLGAKLSYSRFIKTQAGGLFLKNCEGASAFIDYLANQSEGYLDKARSDIMWMAIARFLIRLLVADLEQRKVPITLQILSSNLVRLPEVFAAAFPGYGEHGVVHLVLSAMGREQ